VTTLSTHGGRIGPAASDTEKIDATIAIVTAIFLRMEIFVVFIGG
jgi:hypothetical protein